MSPLSLQMGVCVSINTPLVFLCYSSFALCRNDIISLLPASRHLQRMIQPHPSLPPLPRLPSLLCNESVVQTAFECESTQCCGQTVRPLEHLRSLFFYFGLCVLEREAGIITGLMCVSLSLSHTCYLRSDRMDSQ